VEDNTDGSFYLQGERVHFFATTSSDKAVITSTSVVLVEVEQNLDELVLTGYNRVPYDSDILDLTVWSPAGAGRIADGTVTVNEGAGDVTVTIMEDSFVSNSGTDFGSYSFEPNEAGFQMNLHAKVFPVNVDSFGSKTVLATLEVEYEALSGLSRRRLLSASKSTDFRSSAEFTLNAWQPTVAAPQGDVATMKIELTVQQTAITRQNVLGFVHSFEEAILAALKSESSTRVFESQVVVESVWSKDTEIWARPTTSSLNNKRRKLDVFSSQKLTSFSLWSARKEEIPPRTWWRSLTVSFVHLPAH